MTDMQPDISTMDVQQLKTLLEELAENYRLGRAQLKIIPDIFEDFVVTRKALIVDMVRKHAEAIFKPSDSLPTILSVFHNEIHSRYPDLDVDPLVQALKNHNHIISNVHNIKAEAKSLVKKPEDLFELEDDVSTLEIDIQQQKEYLSSLSDRYQRHPYRGAFEGCKHYNENEGVFFGEHVILLTSETIQKHYFYGENSRKRKDFVANVDKILEKARKATKQPSLEVPELIKQLAQIEGLVETTKKEESKLDALKGRLEIKSRKKQEIEKAKNALRANPIEHSLQTLSQRAVEICCDLTQIHQDFLTDTQFEPFATICQNQIDLAYLLKTHAKTLAKGFYREMENEIRNYTAVELRDIADSVNGPHISIKVNTKATIQPSHNALLFATMVALTSVKVISEIETSDSIIQNSDDLYDALPKYKYVFDMLLQQSTRKKAKASLVEEASNVIKTDFEKAVAWNPSGSSFTHVFATDLDPLRVELENQTEQEPEDNPVKEKRKKLFKRRFS